VSLTPQARAAFYLIAGVVAAAVASTLVQPFSLAQELIPAGGCLVTAGLDVRYRLLSRTDPVLGRLFRPGAGGSMKFIPVWTVAALGTVVGALNAHW
jgi:hypothetical protein